jgi:uncharacterized protein (TIGR03067 family)
MTWVFFLGFLSSAVLFGGDRKDNAKELEGKWVIVSVDDGHDKSTTEKELPTATDLGKSLSEAIKQTLEVTLVLEGDRFSVEVGGGKLGSGTYTTDPQAIPRAIDFMIQEVLEKKKDKDEVVRGIYKLDGKKLLICLGETKRPPNFKASARGKAALLTLERKKKQ